MRRRNFITVITGAAIVWPLVVRAQQKAGIPQLCVLAADSLSSAWASRYAGLIQGLGDLGYVEGTTSASTSYPKTGGMSGSQLSQPSACASTSYARKLVTV